MLGSKNANQPNSEIMTTGEVARFLKVGVGAVRRWAREGTLKGYRMGGRGEWRYIKEDVIKFLMGGNLSLALALFCLDFA